MRRTGRLRLAGVLAAALLGAAVVPVAIPGTSGAFVAGITNPANTTATASRFTCLSDFTSTLLSQNAYFEYQLTGSATTATDSSSAGNPGTFQGGHPTETATAASACPNDRTVSGGTGPYSYTPNGSTNFISTSTPVGTTPADISLVLWFRTSLNGPGGYLMGLGNSQTGDSTQYDRHVYLDDSGHLLFGVYNGTTEVITTPGAYNDGAWHQVVATMSGSAGTALYVDGAFVVGNATYTVAEGDGGYWRVAGGKLQGWLNAPVNTFFSGALRFAAAYRIALSAGQVAAEYANGKPGAVGG